MIKPMARVYRLQAGWHAQLSRPRFTQPACRPTGASRWSRSIPIARAAEILSSPTSNGVEPGVQISTVPAVLSTPAVSIPAPSTSPPALLVPSAVYQKIASLGEAKASLPPQKILAMGTLAGIFISFGACLAMSVGGACPGIAATNPGLQKIISGAFGLPFGLLMVLICGAELFTGNTALLATAAFEGRASVKALAKNWFWSYAGNLAGSLLVASLVVATGVFAAAPAKVYGTAVAKCSLTFTQAFTRGILCNWLVCIALWQASAASTLGGKAVAVWFPISAFVAMGLEHSVANMFTVPLCIMLGAPITWSKFLLANLLPVTLGNVVGGVICVAAAFSYCYGRLGQPSAA